MPPDNPFDDGARVELPHLVPALMSADLFDLHGRRALVAGSSQGIGFALAQGLPQGRASGVLNRRAAEKRAAAAASVSGAATLAFDVGDHAAVVAAIDGFEAAEGPIDIVVNNAGVQHRAPLEDFPPEDFERLMRTNVSSVFNVGQACARHMIPRGHGKIINISSVNASLARASIAPYTATKGAVAQLTKGMATDWARYGLNCNAIGPGYMRTPLNEPLWSDPDFNEWLARRAPAGGRGRAPGGGRRRGAGDGPRSSSGRACSSPRRPRRSSTGRCSMSTAASRRRSDDGAPLGAALHREHQPEAPRGGRGDRRGDGCGRRLAGPLARGGVRPRARDRAGARLLRGAARGSGDRRGLQPPAQLDARAVEGVGARGGQARPVREADVAASRAGRGGVRGRAAAGPASGGGVHVAPPPADPPAARAARRGRRRAAADGHGVVLLPAG